ncbi:CD2-binding protein-related [Striga asiatica]|uniref:CD2-binding protein-related n=1 Tax=Striga asiatica TaxID=4170 RepID=A0A5A7RDF2_STRAF|nr:CD2-binding protein-related [Striga asiatica]
MAEESSRGSLKRSFVDDDESNKPPPEKRVRFPKGKKIKGGDFVRDEGGEDIPKFKDPKSAASDRAVRRSKNTTELFIDENNDFVPDIKRAEVQYKNNEPFVEEGVELEPFNLDKEREEGYFDENGNYVEYMMQNEIKDAWLDSVDVYEKFDGKSSISTSNDEPRDLATDELAEINRRIADVLEPGETVLRALRRLKGSTDKKQKMSAQTKQQFDQLTEDAMKLMENGDYDVYEEKREHFEREAGVFCCLANEISLTFNDMIASEGYEKLVKARKQGISGTSVQEESGDIFDMFGDNDGSAPENPATNGSGSASVLQPESGEPQNDYVYDESSGYASFHVNFTLWTMHNLKLAVGFRYYYSSSSGYYYDPSSGLYCCAASGKWYAYNEESGTYDEVQQDTSVAEAS